MSFPGFSKEEDFAGQRGFYLLGILVLPVTYMQGLYLNGALCQQYFHLSNKNIFSSSYQVIVSDFIKY